MQTLILVSLCFLVSMLVTHIPMIRVKRYQKGVIRDRDDWAVRLEQSDYLYLLLALFAIVPASNDIDRLALRSELDERLLSDFAPQAARKKLMLYSGQEGKVLDDRQADLEAFLLRDDQSISGAESLHDQARELLKIRQYQKAQKCLVIATELYRQLSSQLIFLGADPEISPNVYPRPKDNAQFIFQWVDSDLRNSSALLEIATKLDWHDYSMSFVRLGPYLLVIGFAIRFAKTSGKLLLEAQKRLPRGPAHPCQ